MKQFLFRVLSGLFIAGFVSFSAAADPNPLGFEEWKTDFSITTISMSEILSGGPPKDGIPSIDAPKFVAVDEAKNMKEREPVIALEIGEKARAYPLSILMWHEIVNDNFEGRAVTVTYCPLCNASIVFDAMLDGKAHDFGTTGRLRNSDLLMYDRQSESWWQQFTGEAVIGQHAGKKLKMIPSRVESWQSFKTRHPNGQVLVPNNPDMRDYGRNPYVTYDGRSAPYPLFTGELPENIGAMERVIVLRDKEGAAKAAITLSAVRKAGNFSLEGFELDWKEGQASALDSAIIDKGREVGNLNVIRDGKPALHDITFAFVVHAFLPDLEIRQ